MKIVEKRLDEIRPYEKNPRRNDDAVDYVANSIREFGWKQPIVIDKDGVIIAGHTRYKAAKKLGMKTAPCIMADDLTKDQVKAYRLADNKVGEFAEWDFDALKQELDGIELNMEEFGFDFDNRTNEWFDREQKDGAERQEGNDEYNDFLDKFEAKKTTDDCYTPSNVYDAVAEWVETEYNVNRGSFVRPFYPGGDYKKEKYKIGCVVVDNPPFSILAEIIDFYTAGGIKFFLFAPGLSALGYVTREKVCAICTYAGVTYENGANVVTSFVTNLGDGTIIAKSSPSLFAAIDKANDENEKAMRVQFPKYEFPDEVLTAAKLGWLAKYGQAMEIKRSESLFIRQLDAMKDSGKSIYGNALLLSERAAAERAAAERAAAVKWKLSDREKEIVRNLGTNG